MKWAESFADFQQTTCHFIPGDRIVPNHCCGNLKSYIFLMWFMCGSKFENPDLTGNWAIAMVTFPYLPPILMVLSALCHPLCLVAPATREYEFSSSLQKYYMGLQKEMAWRI
jgi:hypothetical protein